MKLKKINILARVDFWLMLLFIGIFIYSTEQENTTYSNIIFFTALIVFLASFLNLFFYLNKQNNSNIHRKPKKSETILIEVKKDIEIKVGTTDTKTFFYYLYTRKIKNVEKLSSFISSKKLIEKKEYIINSLGNFIVQ